MLPLLVKVDFEELFISVQCSCNYYMQLVTREAPLKTHPLTRTIRTRYVTWKIGGYNIKRSYKLNLNQVHTK